MAGCPGVKKFLPAIGATGNAHFWVRTSTIFGQKKFALLSDPLFVAPCYTPSFRDLCRTKLSRRTFHSEVKRPSENLSGGADLGCRKWGFKRWGFKEIRGYLRKKAFFLRYPEFSRCSSGPPEKGEKRQKRAKKADFS